MVSLLSTFPSIFYHKTFMLKPLLWMFWYWQKTSASVSKYHQMKSPSVSIWFHLFDNSVGNALQIKLQAKSWTSLTVLWNVIQLWWYNYPLFALKSSGQHLKRTFTTDPPSKQKKIIFFCYILSLLAKWNMIFFLYGAFLENSLSKQNFPSPHLLAVCMQGEGESLSFFSKASCTVHGFA